MKDEKNSLDQGGTGVLRDRSMERSRSTGHEIWSNSSVNEIEVIIKHLFKWWRVMSGNGGGIVEATSRRKVHCSIW
jgi:hypothetical protein